MAAECELAKEPSRIAPHIEQHANHVIVSEGDWEERLQQKVCELGITVAFDWPKGCFPPSIVPWGVTASLGCWRELAVEAGGFDLAYAKAGGGEDVAFCIDVQRDPGRPTWGRSIQMTHQRFERSASIA